MKNRRTRDRTATVPVWGLSGFLLLVSAQRLQGQAGNVHSLSESAPDPRMSITSSGPVAQEIFREIDDPNSGTRWLLLRDQQNPAGPGRMVQAAEARRRFGTIPAPEGPTADPAPRPIIHAGDRLIVEENTPIVGAHLEAIALGPAAAGSLIKVRLRIGGRSVRATALGPGRAALQPESGVRP